MNLHIVAIKKKLVLPIHIRKIPSSIRENAGFERKRKGTV